MDEERACQMIDRPNESRDGIDAKGSLLVDILIEQ